MDRKMAADLDNFITGHYGEDQFKNNNYNCVWKVGDRWVAAGQDSYILARTSVPNRRMPCVQFINMRTGNAWTKATFFPKDVNDWDGETVPIEEICKMIFGRDISSSTSGEDNVRLDSLEEFQHEYGPAW